MYMYIIMTRILEKVFPCYVLIFNTNHNLLHLAFLCTYTLISSPNSTMSSVSFFSSTFKTRSQGRIFHSSLSTKQKLQGQIDSDSHEATDYDSNSPSSSSSELSSNGM